MSRLLRVVLGVLMASCLTSIAVVDAPWASAQENYRAVTAEDVVHLRLNHYFTANRESHPPDFEWNFSKLEFVVKKGKGDIPSELAEKLLPSGVRSEEIRGKWRVQDGRLILSAIKGSEQTSNKEVTLPIYRTAPSVVRIGEPQYVFAVEK